MVTSSDVIVPRREEQQHQHQQQYYNGGNGEYGAMMTTTVAPRIRVEIANGIRKGEKFITELSGCERVRDFVSMKLCKNEYLRGREVKVYLDEYELLGDSSVDVLGHEDKIFVVVCDEGDEMEEEEEVDDGFAGLRAELEKREEEKKKEKPNRSGWAFVGKRKEPEKEEKETLDEDDEEEENDSDIIPTQQIGDDDDDEMQDADVIDSQPREKSNNVVRGGFFKFFGNKTPSVAQHPVKQPSPTRSRENVRISSPREGGDDDGDDLPQMQIDDDDDDEDEPTAFNEQKIALVPMVVQQQSYQSPPKPQQPKRRVQSPPQQHQYHHQRSSPPQQVARRVTGKFSEEEVLAVIRGVETYGLGKWKLIRESSLDGVLLGRTPVDVKDKYRNLKSSDLKRVLTGIVPRSASYPFVEEHFEKVRRAAEDAH